MLKSENAYMHIIFLGIDVGLFSQKDKRGSGIFYKAVLYQGRSVYGAAAPSFGEERWEKDFPVPFECPIIGV